MGAQGELQYPLSERAQHLLKVLVERYIREGEPVGSRTLARESGLDISAATVRNVMADLEEMGLVRSPHTSAGRVPTVRGYRFFVDSLLKVRPLDEGDVRHLEAEIEEAAAESDPHGLAERASEILSEVTRMAGVVTVPRTEFRALRQVEFLPLSGSRALAILVVDEREVQNRVIETGRPYGAEELQRISNYLNEHFAGLTLEEIRESLVRDMEAARADMDRLMGEAIEMGRRALMSPPEQDEDLVLSGETRLMRFQELSDVEKLRQLFEAFEQKRELLGLLDRCVRADGVRIFIGEESGYEPLGDCSVVTAPYRVEGRVVGVLGVIGPTRMAYDRVIPIVDVTARLLGAALNPRV